jgi:hypothetical protein
MGLIENYQNDFLLQGSEQISYKVFNYEGTYIETTDDDVLFTAPKDLHPINNDLLKSYEKPLKEVQFVTDLTKLEVKSVNPNMAIPSDLTSLTGDFEVASTSAGFSSTDYSFASDYSQNVKAISGNRYFKSTAINTTGTVIYDFITCPATVKQNQDLQIGFSYYFGTTSTVAEYIISIRLNVDLSGDGTADHRFNFDTNEWDSSTNTTFSASSASAYTKGITTETLNKWQTFTLTVPPFETSSDNNDKTVKLRMGRPEQLSANGTHSATYIDNFYIAEKYDVTDNKMISKRRQLDSAGTYTGLYKNEKNIISNEAKETDFFMGRYLGDYKRLRDTSNKTMEQIVSQEILNDHRQYLRKYEGTFYNLTLNHISMHNKILFDFGQELLRENVSCYLDGMEHNMKENKYNLKMHVPNQDDDVDSTYQTVFE